MLTDILEASKAWKSRYVVTDDQATTELAREHGCQAVQDPGTGLNPSIAAATRVALGDGASSLLVLPSDVPLVSPSELRELFDRSEEVVVVPSKDAGTNALRLTPPHAIEPMFGPKSSAAHIEAARKANLSSVLLQMTSVFLDIDAVDDLIQLANSSDGAASIGVARELLASVQLGGLRAPDDS